MNYFNCISKRMTGTKAESLACSLSDELEGKVCNALNGIERKPGYKIARSIILTIFSVMAFDIISKGALLNLFTAI